jgi:hypothetical protein
MCASTSSLVPRPNRAKNPPRRRRVKRREQRERILRERVTYMLWVMANTVD